MRKRIIPLALSLALCLSGCGYVAPRSYSSVSPYIEQWTDAEDTSILRASSYAELLNGVQYFVTKGEQEGVIRLYQYTGDVETDLETACREVLEEDPLGAYALEDITYHYSHIVTYYECTITYTYSRTKAQINAIQKLSGTGLIRSAIADALQRGSGELVLDTSDAYADPDRILGLVQEAYYQYPAFAIEYPDPLVTVYPDTGSRRVVEIAFHWQLSPEELEQRQEAVQTAAAQMVNSGVSGDTNGLWLLYSRLSEVLVYDEAGSRSVYAPFFGEAANSEGTALAFQTLCDVAGISCELVQGTMDGTSHWWNIVTTKEGSYHVDVSQQQGEDAFLRYDEDMTQHYSWDRQAHTSCLPPEEEPQTGTPDAPAAPATTDQASTPEDDSAGSEENKIA
jgi:hypothetical protein